MRHPLLTIARKAASTSSAPAFSLISAGEPSAMIRPSRISSSRSQRSASSITWLETKTAVPASASRWNSAHSSTRSTGSSPTVGSSSTSRSRRAEQRDRQAGPAALAAAEPADHLVAVARQVDGLDHPVDLGRVDAEHAGEEPQVLGDGQVVVHAGRLGDVADPVSQRLAPGRLAEDADRAAGDLLDADQAAHQRGLAAAGRAEQAGHPAADRDVELLQHRPPAAHDEQAADLHRVFHHVMNSAPVPAR